MKRRISEELGLPLVRLFAAGEPLSAEQMKTAVRFSLEEFAERYPGRAVEIRIPWIGAVQAIAGMNHRRGTPPNVVEMDGQTWLSLVTGKLSWGKNELGNTPNNEADHTPAPALDAISFSGTRADLSQYLPLF